MFICLSLPINIGKEDYIVKYLKRYEIDGRATRINNTDLPNWWVLQQHFAYPPFNEFFDTDKLIEYYSEFVDGGIYQLEINIIDDIWLPVGLISWHPMIEGAHPVNFTNIEKVAYISDSITYKSYQNKGIQTKLFDYAFGQMRMQNYKTVYLRTSPNSNMCKLAVKLGFKQVNGVFQKVRTMRVSGYEEEDTRIFFSRNL